MWPLELGSSFWFRVSSCPLLALAGCDLITPKPATRPTTQPGEVRLASPGYRLTGTNTGTAGPADGQPSLAAKLQLTVYLLDVPFGTVSHDEGLWRTVDENAVGAAADQRLLANGIRCGVAPRDRWPAFYDVFRQDVNRGRRTVVDGMGNQTVELDVAQPVDHEDLWCLGPDGQWDGRTFDGATNGVACTFGPTPRQPGSARVTLTPVVQRRQRRLAFTDLNQPYEVPEQVVLRLYDMGLTVDVPPNGFLLVAPGPMADPVDVTVGGRFLVRRDAAARREMVIVAVPTFVPLNGREVRVPAG